MVQNALDMSVAASSEEASAASLAVTSLAEQGMVLPETEVLTRGDAAQMLYQASKLSMA